MAKVIYPNDNLLLPPCLGDYLPGNHPARVLSATIDRLDISEIESGYAGGGLRRHQAESRLQALQTEVQHSDGNVCRAELNGVEVAQARRAGAAGTKPFFWGISGGRRA